LFPIFALFSCALQQRLSSRLHECRHTFASLLIAAGVNVKAISSYKGHSSCERDAYVVATSNSKPPASLEDG
jgi:integrase